jgi:hypothetical protein
MSIDTLPTKEARATSADRLLSLLQDGPKTTAQLIVQHGHRFSAAKRNLVERGWAIDSVTLDGEVTWTRGLYTPLVEVTDEMKAAYYAGEHWKAKRQERLRRDGFACIFCGFGLTLEVHHWKYDLFAESVDDLSTTCAECHEWIHANEQIHIHFPHYVTPEIAARLLE